MKKICLIVGTVLFANTAIADNPFDVHFDATAPFMEDSDTLIFDGMRVEGAGLSATNDALRVKFDFDYDTLNFVLNRENIKIYSDVGVFNKEHMAVDVVVAQPSYIVNGTTYSFDETYNFEATSSDPFIAELNLEAGHVISWLIDNQSKNYSYGLTGENIDSYFLGEANKSVISGAKKILSSGIYRLKIMPTNSLTLTFSLKLYNANNLLLRKLVDNDRISVSFKRNIRDYAKYKVTLGIGNILTLPQSSSDIRLKLIDNLGNQVVSTIGLALIYEAKKSGEYYLFIDNQNGHGGSYNGTVSIDLVSLSRSKKANNHKSIDKANAATP